MGWGISKPPLLPLKCKTPHGVNCIPIFFLWRQLHSSVVWGSKPWFLLLEFSFPFTSSYQPALVLMPCFRLGFYEDINDAYLKFFCFQLCLHTPLTSSRPLFTALLISHLVTLGCIWSLYCWLPVCPFLIRGTCQCICQVEAMCRAWVGWASSSLLCSFCVSLLRYLSSLGTCLYFQS